MAAIVRQGTARAWGAAMLVVGAWLAIAAAVPAPGLLVERKFTEKNWEAGRDRLTRFGLRVDCRDGRFG